MTGTRVPPSAGSHLRFAVVCVLTGVVALVPLFAVRLPPLVDVPGHVGRYAIQTGLEDHPWLAQYFSFEWQVIGNLGADLLVELLSPFAGVETSVWLIVALTQFLAATGIMVLCREVHARPTPFALFALPLIYGVPFNYGFVNFSLSMALALWAFTLWLRLTRTNRHRLRSWLFVPISLGIWLCHTFGWAFLGLLCFAESLVRAREAGRAWHLAVWDTGWRCLPLAAPLAPMLLWRSQAAAGGGTEIWFAIGVKLIWLQSILRLDNEAADKVSATILFGLVSFCLFSHRLSRDRAMLTTAALSLLAFLILPMRLFGSYFADMRLVPYIMIVALLGISDRKLTDGSRRWLMAAAVAFFVVRIGLTTATYVQRERILDAQLEALDAIPERARVATLVSLPCVGKWELPWLTHIGGLATARKHAYANNQWVGGSVNLLSVHYPEAGEFAHDPSEMVISECGGERVAMRQAFEAVPASAFTNVWILGLQPGQHPSRDGFVAVWQGPDSAVYRRVGAH